ncbi:MAG: hypothetical protein V4541_12390 [Bacteroidota bacterium]
MKIELQKLILRRLIIVLLVTLTTTAFGQNAASFEKEMKAKMTDFFSGPNTEGLIKAPQLGSNDASSSLMVPTGFGGSGFNLFGGIGGAYPQVYTNSPDLTAAVGLCVGNPFSAVNVAASLSISDVSDFNNYSGNLVISKRIFTGSSIAAGIVNLFSNSKVSDYAKSTYYVAFSHAVQSIASKTPGSSRLTYGIGIGNGRFYDKSPADFKNGKGKHGTAVFANVSYEVFQHVNLNAEWTGLNLGLSAGIRPFNTPLSLGVGVTNLTNYSADKPNMIFSLGYPLSLTH